MRLLAVSFLLSLLVTSEVPAQNSRQGGLPNILIVVVDDLGWNDVSYHGSEIETPTLDTLASDGIELDRFYTAPFCTPTRAGWLTGRYSIRFGMHGTVIAPYELRGFPDAEDTVPEMLARAGYTQRGIVGKWHLGHMRDDYHPLNHGFTEFYGSYTGNLDYFTHLKLDELDWHKDMATNTDAGYVTDLIADEAIQFIEENAAAPFFLYLPFTAPHTPLQAPTECLDRYPSLPDGERKTYAAMVSCFDDQLARILQALEDHDIRDNTLVWFFSDNGANESEGGDNAPLRGRKGQTFEGGIRTPAIVHWPDGGLSGGARLDSLVSYLDIYPTLARVAGQTGTPVNALDGFDVLDLLQGNGTEPNRDFYSFVDSGDSEELSIIADEWKLRWRGDDLLEDPDGGTVLQLYAILEDPLESTNLSAGNPTIVVDLISRLQSFRTLRPAQHIDFHSPPPLGFIPPIEWVMHADTIATPLAVAPVDSVATDSATVTLRWNDIAAAATYVVQVSTSPDFETLAASSGAVSDTMLAVVLTRDSTYHWRVRAINTRVDNYSFWSDASAFVVPALLPNGIDELPTELSLDGVYPNPIGVQATVRFSLPGAGNVVVAVVDALGREVARIADGTFNAGVHTLQLDSSQLASGTYFVRMITNEKVQTSRFTIVR